MGELCSLHRIVHVTLVFFRCCYVIKGFCIACLCRFVFIFVSLDVHVSAHDLSFFHVHFFLLKVVKQVDHRDSIFCSESIVFGLENFLKEHPNLLIRLHLHVVEIERVFCVKVSNLSITIFELAIFEKALSQELDSARF